MSSPASDAPSLSHALSLLASAAQALAAAAQALACAQTSGNLSCASDPLSLSLPSLPEVSRQFRGSFAAPSPSPFLVEAVNEFLLCKARAGRSDRYLRQLRVSLRSFAKGRARVPIASLGPGDVERWLNASGWAPRTRRGYLGDLSALFTWCVRRGFMAGNPAAAVDVPRAASRPPGIVTPDQAREILEHARSLDIGAARVLALRLFAGIRTAESLRLVESDLAGGFVRVEAAKSKTRARRLVPIQPALAAWLALEGGPLPVSEKRMRRVLAGSALPQNWARHSFCSYRLSACESASRVALEAGHSETVLFRAYRELVAPGLADRYWAIAPL